MKLGKFVISMDFELMRGMFDVKTIDQYGEYIKKVKQVILRLLETFKRHNINPTFSTVGFLFFETKHDLLQNLAPQLPNFLHSNLLPYSDYIEKIGKNYQEDPYHFAQELIKLIMQYPNQAIGNHTFSHYYCLEEGQTTKDFMNGRKNDRGQVQ